MNAGSVSTPPRVLHVTISDRGGAGLACMRLHHALRNVGIDSRVLVRDLAEETAGVMRAPARRLSLFRARLDSLRLKLYPRRRIFAWWSVNSFAGGPAIPHGTWEPDLVHLHWIGDSFIGMDWLAGTGKPVIWTIHDMWPFTGGCHYAAACERFLDGCGSCPQLGSVRRRDLSSRSINLKKNTWKRVHGVVVAPSTWLADTARQSAVFKGARVEAIPNGLDGSLFYPESRVEARRRLHLPDDDRILVTGLAGALDDERKGFTLLLDALKACRDKARREKWRLVVFGATEGPGEDAAGIPVTYCGQVRHESQLNTIYNAADVYVLPSRQDNLPNTVVEALACGRPVAGFRIAGLASMIDDGRTGWLAQPFSPESLAGAISRAMDGSAEDWEQTCRREFEARYAWPGPAHQYARLYAALLSERPRAS